MPQPLDLSQITLAIGSIGLAATALVESTKTVLGGISNVGFNFIEKVVTDLLPAPQKGEASESGLTRQQIVDTLHANWINGVASGDQKAAAKSLLKLHLTPATAPQLAAATNVSPTVLAAVAAQVAANAPMSPAQADTFGRFDVALSALLDRAYQRGDQLYRHCAQVLAGIFAILLAFAGDYSLSFSQDPVTHAQVFSWYLSPAVALLVGVIATPLAPVAKDISSAISTASEAIQTIRGK